MFIYLRRTLEPNIGNKHLWTKDLDATFSLFNNRRYNEITWGPLWRRLFWVKLHISGLQFYWKWNNIAFKTFSAKGNDGMHFRYRHWWTIFVFLQMHLSREIISSRITIVTYHNCHASFEVINSLFQVFLYIHFCIKLFLFDVYLFPSTFTLSLRIESCAS